MLLLLLPCFLDASNSLPLQMTGRKLLPFYSPLDRMCFCFYCHAPLVPAALFQCHWRGANSYLRNNVYILTHVPITFSHMGASLCCTMSIPCARLFLLVLMTRQQRVLPNIIVAHVLLLLSTADASLYHRRTRAPASFITCANSLPP